MRFSSRQMESGVISLFFLLDEHLGLGINSLLKFG